MTEQLDWVGTTLCPPSAYQPELLAPRVPSLRAVEQHFRSLTQSDIDRHKDLWSKITPTKSEQIFQRYLFAFLSVHTSWEMNVQAYLKLKDWYEWANDEEVLWTKLNEAGVGLHNNRVKYITLFARAYWKASGEFVKAPCETWTQCRDRLEKKLLGLGLAKSSFALELIYPTESSVACLDVHMFRLYGMNQTKDRTRYKELEAHWVQWSKMYNVPSFMARAIYWNKRQGHPDCRYWAYVFE